MYRTPFKRFFFVLHIEAAIVFAHAQKKPLHQRVKLGLSHSHESRNKRGYCCVLSCIFAPLFSISHLHACYLSCYQKGAKRKDAPFFLFQSLTCVLSFFLPTNRVQNEKMLIEIEEISILEDSNEIRLK